MKPRSYSYTKILRILWQKGDPWGDLSAPKATLDSRFPYSLSDLLKDSENVKITISQNHFKSTFGSAHFISKNSEIKLAKSAKTEPRKARFPWDIGLLFVQPIKSTDISEYLIYRTAIKTTLTASYWFFTKILAKLRQLS